MLSHLREQKFKHNFYHTLKCSCSGGLDTETAPHCFFYYPFVNFSWMMYSPEYYELNWQFNINQKPVIVTHFLLYGKDSFKHKVNPLTSNVAIEFIV